MSVTEGFGESGFITGGAASNEEADQASPTTVLPFDLARISLFEKLETQLFSLARGKGTKLELNDAMKAFSELSQRIASIEERLRILQRRLRTIKRI